MINLRQEMAKQLELLPAGRVTPEDEHLFRRWMAGERCEQLGAERGVDELKMIGVIAGIWRRISR